MLEDGREYYHLYNVRVPGSVLGDGEGPWIDASVFVDVETRSVWQWRGVVVSGSQRGLHTFDFLEYDYGLSIEMPCDP